MSMTTELQAVIDDIVRECPEDSGNYSLGICYCQYHTWARQISDAVGGLHVPEPSKAEAYSGGDLV